MATGEVLSLSAVAFDQQKTRGVVSLPLPREGGGVPVVEGCTTQAVPVGYWPRSEAMPGEPRRPRRALVYFAGDEPLTASPSVHLEGGTLPASEPAEDAAGALGWRFETPCVEEVRHHADAVNWHYYKHVNELRLGYGDKEIGLQLGIDNAWGPHVWQFVMVQPLWSGPLCAAYTVGGHIFCGHDHQVSHKEQKYRHGGMSDHPPDETVIAQLFVVLHRDGALSATAHFINGRVYHGVGPTVGMPVVMVRGLGEAVSEQGEPWIGSAGLTHNGIVFDPTPAAHMVSQAHPGRMWHRAEAPDALVWQPFEDTRIDVRTRPDERGGIAEDVIDDSPKGLVKGAARSVPFALSLAGAPCGEQRYLAPPACYAANEEIAPMPLVHREGPHCEISRMGAKAFGENTIVGRFTAGAIYRYLYMHGQGTYEISMDGNESRSLYRWAYWSGDEDAYALAARNATFCADLAVDHSRDIVHYHGDRGAWQVYSLIYMRVSGLVYAYLENGDPYYIEIVRRVANSYMNQHRLNWPRQGMGRDLDPLAGFGVLYDYTGDEVYLDFMREVADNATRVIHENGMWYSGAGVGPYWGVNATEGGAWNGGHFFHGITEYVMRAETFPDRWREPMRMALRRILMELWNGEHKYHPASCGFLPRLHWYLACRLGDEELIDIARQLTEHLLVYKDNPTDQPMFRGGKAHHMNNYLDYLLFYESTKDTLPERLARQG